MQKINNILSFFWLICATGILFTVFLWCLQKEETKNWIEEPSDELMDY